MVCRQASDPRIWRTPLIHEILEASDPRIWRTALVHEFLGCGGGAQAERASTTLHGQLQAADGFEGEIEQAVAGRLLLLPVAVIPFGGADVVARVQQLAVHDTAERGSGEHR